MRTEFKRIIALLLAITTLILTLASCQSSDDNANNENFENNENSENNETTVTDDGTILATTRYEYTPGTYGDGGVGVDNLIGTISSSNGLLWYEFDEGAGATVLRSSLTQARDSTAMNATMVPDGGVSEGAVSFNGVDEYVKLNNSFSDLSQITPSTFLHPAYSSISISFYIKPETTAGKQLIFEQGDNRRGIAIAIIDGKLVVGTGFGDSETGNGNPSTMSCDYPYDISDEKWTHIAVSFDGACSGGTVSVYIDGERRFISATAGKYLPQTLDAAGIGSAQFGTNILSLEGDCYYKGMMDDLRIYSTAITHTGELESRAVYLQSASAKNHYIKASAMPCVDDMVEPSLRGFVLTYGLADRDGYSFRQTGTDNFLVHINGQLYLIKPTMDEYKKGATFYAEDALALPSWGEHTPGAFRSYKAYETDHYITAKDGFITVEAPDSENLLSSVFKVTGDQTQVVSGLKGAVYYPSYALNAPQFWKWYDRMIIDRDMGYATDILGINSFRIWVSYEYWLEDPVHFEAAFRDFLDLAENHEISIMVSLFEGCGDGYDYYSDITWSRDYTGNRASWSVTSPCAAVYNNKREWDGPKSFVTYFINTFGDDSRLMAIETYNEPWGSRSDLAMYLTEYAVTIQKSVPLTLGTAPADPASVIYSVEAGMDMIHYHDNFPSSTQAFEDNAVNRKDQGRLANLPVYCTEVQWVGGPANINYPVYSNLAPTVNKLMEDGTWAPYYWTLMVHPCYLNSYRNNYNMYNGIINEDGTVNNKANAEAISNSPISALQSTMNPYKDGSYTYKYNFSDNFFDLKAYKWTAAFGNWSAETGAYSGNGITFANDTAFSDFEATFTLEGSGGLVFRAKDKNNYYYAEYDDSAKVLKIHKCTDGKLTLLAISSNIESDASSITLSVSAKGSTLRIFANCGEARVEDNAFTSGLVGFKADSTSTFDDLRVSIVE